jgi:hypothetical protein
VMLISSGIIAESILFVYKEVDARCLWSGGPLEGGSGAPNRRGNDFNIERGGFW